MNGHDQDTSQIPAVGCFLRFIAFLCPILMYPLGGMYGAAIGLVPMGILLVISWSPVLRWAYERDFPKKLQLMLDLLGVLTMGLAIALIVYTDRHHVLKEFYAECLLLYFGGFVALVVGAYYRSGARRISRRTMNTVIMLFDIVIILCSGFVLYFLILAMQGM